jgi:acylphosphatase
VKLGISGYAKNLPNGDVEVLAAGDELALELLCRWLHDGPPMARVSSVDEQLRSSGESPTPRGFTIA